MASIMCPNDSLGAIMQLCQDKRGEQIHMEYFGRDRVMVKYNLPFAEMMFAVGTQLRSPLGVNSVPSSRRNA